MSTKLLPLHTGHKPVLLFAAKRWWWAGAYEGGREFALQELGITNYHKHADQLVKELVQEYRKLLIEHRRYIIEESDAHYGLPPEVTGYLSQRPMPGRHDRYAAPHLEDVDHE